MHETKKKAYHYAYAILFLIFLPNTAIEKSVSSSNGLLKKRVANRQAHQKINSFLGEQKENVQEVAASLKNMDTLLTLLQAPSIDEALQIVEQMKQDINDLLMALGATSIPTGIKKAKKVDSITKKLKKLNVE